MDVKHQTRKKDNMATVVETVPSFTFVPRAKAQSAQPAQIDVDKVPEWIAKQCEEVYETLKTNPGSIYVKFNTLAEMNTFLTFAKAYCANRPGGAVKFHKSPIKNLEPTEMQFTIKDFNKEALEIRAAVDKVKEAAAK